MSDPITTRPPAARRAFDALQLVALLVGVAVGGVATLGTALLVGMLLVLMSQSIGLLLVAGAVLLPLYLVAQHQLAQAKARRRVRRLEASFQAPAVERQP